MPNKIPNKWDDIFYSGDFPQGRFSEADLNQMLQNFYTEFHQSKSKYVLPLVKGHPTENNHPSFGWVDGVRLVNDGDKVKLQASYFDVEDKFKDDVIKGRFPNKSVRVEKTKDGWQLSHIGFLGATKPALNLPRTQFNKDESIEEIQIIQFSIPNEVINNMPDPNQDQSSNSDAVALLAKSQGELDATKNKLSEITGKFSDFQKQHASLEEKNKEQAKVIADFELQQKQEKAASLVKDFEFSKEHKQQAIDLILGMSDEQSKSLIGLLNSISAVKEKKEFNRDQYENMPVDVADFAKLDSKEPVFITSLEKMMKQRKELANG